MSLRTIILLDALSLGGAEKQALLFGAWLQNEKKCKVEIWHFMPGDGSAKIVCDRYNLKTKEIGYFRGLARYLYPKQIWEYAKLFKEFKPDLLLGYTNQPNLLLGLIWKKTGAKYFIWGQQGIEAGGYAFDKKADKIALENTPVFISNSKNGGDFLNKTLHVPTEKIKVVYNGPEKIDPIFSKEEWRSKLGIGNHDFVALMVAHIALRKDHHTLLLAWKIVVETLQKSNINPCLLLAGMLGNATQELISLAIELGIYGNVKFLGNVKDISGLNLASDIHILSSNTEGLPNSLLEAMNLKIPVVGTNIPGIFEAVGAENAEFLSEPKDAEGLAKNILKFALNPSLIQEIGSKNHNRIQNFFSLEKMCQEHWDLIQKNCLS
ncbi:MAG: glycosyltransferase family 4 protein [Bacteroidia bacterium]|nr:glycosyltransferase family 4 protein [Bacteroidia bacterium]